jgi:hypothetical protein
MLLAFLLAGRYLDQSMRRKTRAVAGNLAALKGETRRNSSAPMKSASCRLPPCRQATSSAAPGERSASTAP